MTKLIFLIPLCLQAAAMAQPVQPERVVIYEFSVLTETRSSPPTLSEEACNGAGRIKGDSLTKMDPALLGEITRELQKEMSKRISAIVGDPDTPAPPRSLLIAGCINRAEPGNAAKRMAGMGLGASHLDAHVRLSLVTQAALTMFDEFDVHVKGAKALPPIGPVGIATHAAAEHRETLKADAKKVADRVAAAVTVKLKALSN